LIPPLSPSYFSFFFFYAYSDLRDLHSFPTRRSSDLFLEVLLFHYIVARLNSFARSFHLIAIKHQRRAIAYHPNDQPLRGLRKSIDRKSTRLNSSHDQISYAVFCLKKKTKQRQITSIR